MLQSRKSVEHSGYQLMQCRMVMAMKVYPVPCNNIIAMSEKGIMVSQNCLGSQKYVPGSHSEACSSSSISGVQAVKIKIEEFSDIEDSKDPEPMTVVGLKTEHEVSCMSPLCHCDAHLSHIQNFQFFLIIIFHTKL
jgi:hypothetical protein